MLKQVLSFIAALVILITITASCNKGEGDNPKPDPIPACRPTYESDIKTVVQAKCALSGCHDGTSGLVNFLTYGPLKAKADEGKIKRYVFELNIMPPATATQLIENEREKLQCWLDNGAPEN